MTSSTFQIASFSALAVFLSACSGGGGGSDSPPDTTAPIVSAITPDNSANSVNRTALVSATFNEDILGKSVSAGSITLTSDTDAITGTVDFDAQSNTVTYTPTNKLPKLSTITATVSKDIADLAGNSMAAEYTWSFTTNDGNWREYALLEGSRNSTDLPQVAIDSEGNAFAIWIKAIIGPRYNTYVSRYSASEGNWGEATLIQSDEKYISYDPQVAFDNAGNAMAIWSQSDGTETSIFTNRYSATDKSWEGPVLIEDGRGLADIPQIALDNNGNAMAVWYQNSGAQVDIYANYYSAADNSWGTATLIETDDRGEADYPEVAFDSNGNAFAVWHQTDGTRNSIYANQFSVADKTWGTATLIELDDTSDAKYPQLAIDADGNVMAIWQQSDGARVNIYANRYSSEDSSWGDVALVETDDTGNAQSPQIAFDDNGDAVAVWAQYDGSHRNIYTNRYSSTASKWLGATLVEIDNEGMSSKPQLSIDNDRNIIVVWQNNTPAGEFNIWSNRYTSVNGQWGDAELLESDTLGSGTNPQVAVDADGSAIAIWTHNDTTANDIAVNHFD
ncbi:hypothetical protein BTA51_19990 [Hahella sp. CCB-MM4]|uniref:Ig-like domain-containing protein n=1 Tax=Hahella sp. (strain CCB-MM4) TaxID=1926491 RepID=UPI000B9B1A9D|nr:Ig-like domain-containing protein [Hahella sp. CCB-MM4]OZG71566.1 hypothetical protein BTA51_19990 [Hahella sp. CCB-MM4]